MPNIPYQPVPFAPPLSPQSVCGFSLDAMLTCDWVFVIAVRLVVTRKRIVVWVVVKISGIAIQPTVLVDNNTCSDLCVNVVDVTA